MKKNDGQVLVAFLLLIPLLFFIITALFDFGLLSIQKRKIENALNDALEYASKNQTSDVLEEEVALLLRKNIPNIISLKTTKEKEYFEIEVTCKLNEIFENILKGNNMYTTLKRKKYN